MVANSILIAARVALAGIFLVAATTKLLDMRGFRAALQGFGLTDTSVAVAAVTIPIAEMLVAGLAVPAATARAGASVAIVLLLTFEAAIALALLRGATPECHCFGQLHSRPAGGETLARNALFLGVALVVLVAGPDPDLGSWLDSSRGEAIALTATGLLAAVAAYACVSLWRENRRLQGHTRVRRGGRSLMVGQLAPRFEAVALGGASVSSEQLLADQRHAVLVFTSAACEPCLRLMPELARWRQMLEGRLSIHVVAAGDRAAHRRQAAEHGMPILLDPDRAVAEAFAISATPTGVEIDPEGRIGSSPAVGPQAIEWLIRMLLKPVPISAGDQEQFLRDVKDGRPSFDLSPRDREQLMYLLDKPVRDVDRPPPTRWERSRYYWILNERVTQLLFERHLRTRGKELELEHFEPDLVPYEPSSWLALRWGLRRLSPGPEDVLVDFGCGKGRVICEAARRPFARVIGVEISERLLDVAGENVERNRGRFRCQNIDLVRADATEWEVPDEMTAAYLYHPFVGAVFERVIDNIVESVRRSPRRVRLVYVGPVLERELLATGYFHVVGRRRARGRQMKVFNSVALFEHDPRAPLASRASEVAAASR
ncbi:MAG: MauE/DoxX family redox-associated membrane protein [Solirubrobacteraceae bacterium]